MSKTDKKQNRPEIIELILVVKPEPARVTDPECENYGQILWLKDAKTNYWAHEPNPCPLGRVGDKLDHVDGIYTVVDISMLGGPQLDGTTQPWRWSVLVEKDSSVTAEEE
jgi:hypothetical protein